MPNSNTNLQTQSSNALHNAIMEAGSKDRPPMLAPGNYVQWKSRIKRYIDTKPNSELIHHCLQNPPYTYQWAKKTVPVAEGSSETTTERYMENYKNVLQDIRDQLNAEAEAVQIILTGIDNDIYSTVDACPNACEMWKAIERLKQGESINVQDLETNLYWEFGKFTSRDGESLESYYSRFYNHQVNVQFLLQLQPEWQRFVTLVKQSQELKTVSYHKLYDILKQHQNEVNEIRAERLARTANPLALVAQQQPVYHHQNHPTQNTQYSSTRSQQSTRNRGKAIVTSSAPTYDPEPATVTEDEEMSKEKEIDKLMALISLSFKKIYKPTNNNLRTSSNTSRANQDNSPRINRGTGYDNQRAVNVAGARENVGDWKYDTDDESDDQELEAHYMYMAQLQEVTPDQVDNSGPIFDDEPMHKVQNNNDNYNVFAMENEHPEQPESSNDIYLAEQGDTNITIASSDICYDRAQDDQDETDDLDQERDLLASLIQKLKCEIDDSKNRNKFLESSNKELVDKLKGEIEDFKTKNKSLESSNNHFKEANNELSKTNQLMFKDLKKFQAELDKYNDVNYASKVEIDCAKAKGDLISYALSWKPCQGDSLNLPDHRAQVDQGSQIKMIQVKEMMQDNDLKNSKSKDKGSKSRSQSMNEQSRYKQDKTITRQSINVKCHIFNVIGGSKEFEEKRGPSTWEIVILKIIKSNKNVIGLIKSTSLERTPRDFAKLVKAIALPQDIQSTSDYRLNKLENQVQRLMEAYLAPTQPTLVNKVTTPCEICSGPHDTQYCMEDLEQAFIEYASSRTNKAGEGQVFEFMASQNARLSKFESDFKRQQVEMTNKIDTMLKAITDRIAGTPPSNAVKNPKLGTTLVLSARSYPTIDPQCSSHPSNSINAIKAHFKEATTSQTSLQQPEIENKPS
ncbi:hypothetical protein Tco_1125600 [Tanacetum coccineum]|uniref:Retrotransposon gag domain-containing protein n=1 Tax=Tanacetum coccineum TaxID=301880 RepID=A0ABQ5JB58_9ASTR